MFHRRLVRGSSAMGSAPSRRYLARGDRPLPPRTRSQVGSVKTSCPRLCVSKERAFSRWIYRSSARGVTAARHDAWKWIFRSIGTSRPPSSGLHLWLVDIQLLQTHVPYLHRPACIGRFLRCSEFWLEGNLSHHLQDWSAPRVTSLHSLILTMNTNPPSLPFTNFTHYPPFSCCTNSLLS